MQAFVTSLPKPPSIMFVLLCTASLFMVTGCQKNEETEVYKTDVDYPKIADLEVGVSISRSIAITEAQNNQKQQNQQSNQNQQRTEHTPPSQAVKKPSSNQKDVTLTPVKPSVMQTAQNQPKSANQVNIANKDTIVANKNIKQGSPEATLKKSMDIVYTGDAKQAVQYYHTKTDIEPILEQTQQAFQQRIASITFIETKYNAEKNEAHVISEVRGKNSDEVRKTVFHLKKFDGAWKILEK